MAVDSSKLLERDIGISKGARISAPQVKMLKVVNVKLKDVSGNLKDNLVLSKVRNAAEKRRAEELARKKREKDIESKKGKKAKGGGKIGIKVPFIDRITNFLINFLLGAVVMKLVDFIDSPGVMKFLDYAKDAAKIVGNVGKWILNSLVNLIDWGYKLADGAENWIKNNVSEEAAEKFKTFMTNLKDLFAGFIAWKLIGEKIFKGIVSNIRRVFDILKTVVKGAFKTASRVFKFAWKLLPKRARAGVRLARMGVKKFGKNLLRRGGVVAKRFAGRGVRTFVKGAGKTGSSLMKKGIGGLAKRGALKVFGKTFVKAAGKIFGKVPIIGPLIVGIVSLISGEPLGQALFKTFGAAIGGLLGTFIPIPVLGTLLGEAIGVFVGDLLYHLIIKRDPKAAMKILGDTVRGIFNAGKAIFEWVGRGLQNFTDSFPTFDVPDVGLQDAYIAIADKIGLGGVIDWEIPDWMGIPDGLKGLSIRKILDSLPRIPDILGLVTQFIPGLSAYTEDGKLKKLPAIWQLYNPMFMVPSLIKSFFQGGGSSTPATPKPTAQVSGGGKSDASDVSESASYDKKSGEGKKVIIPIPIHKKQPANIFTSGGGGGGSQSSKKFDPYASLYMGK